MDRSYYYSSKLSFRVSNTNPGSWFSAMALMGPGLDDCFFSVLFSACFFYCCYYLSSSSL